MIKLRLFIFRLFGMNRGPFMIPVRYYWIFVDHYQQTWKLEYTHDHDMPFRISLVER